jgi:hypothetical protein
VSGRKPWKSKEARHMLSKQTFVSQAELDLSRDDYRKCEQMTRPEWGLA